MHPAAEALHNTRSRDAAIAVYTAAEVAAGREAPTSAEAIIGANAVFYDSIWPLLIAPELWAAYEEWLALRRLADYIERLNQGAELISAGLHKPATMVVMEVKTGKVVRHEQGLIGERKSGPDLASVRLGALSDATATLARVEDALARARARFLKMCYAYKARLDAVKKMTPAEQHAALKERALIEDEKALAFAIMSSEETPATAITILDDRTRADRIAELIAKRKERTG